jgi:hypothetical protein
MHVPRELIQDNYERDGTARRPAPVLQVARECLAHDVLKFIAHERVRRVSVGAAREPEFPAFVISIEPEVEDFYDACVVRFSSASQCEVERCCSGAACYGGCCSFPHWCLSLVLNLPVGGGSLLRCVS